MIVPNTPTPKKESKLQFKKNTVVTLVQEDNSYEVVLLKEDLYDTSKYIKALYDVAEKYLLYNTIIHRVPKNHPMHIKEIREANSKEIDELNEELRKQGEEWNVITNSLMLI